MMMNGEEEIEEEEEEVEAKLPSKWDRVYHHPNIWHYHVMRRKRITSHHCT